MDLNLERYSAVVNTHGPRSDVSKKYAFVPTTKVLEILSDWNWTPVKVRQSATKDAEKEGYQHHVIRLRQRDANPVVQGEVFPEIILKNNHCRSGAFQFCMGLYRLVCSNGLVAGQDFGKFSIPHRGFAANLVEQAAAQAAATTPLLLTAVTNWQGINLDSFQRMRFAKEAIELKFNPEEQAYSLAPDMVLTPRRSADRGTDLWSTFNVVQEHLTKGGLYGKDKNGKVRKDRAVNSIDRDLKLNRGLWDLAQRYATQFA